MKSTETKPSQTLSTSTTTDALIPTPSTSTSPTTHLPYSNKWTLNEPIFSNIFKPPQKFIQYWKILNLIIMQRSIDFHLQKGKLSIYTINRLRFWGLLIMLSELCTFLIILNILIKLCALKMLWLMIKVNMRSLMLLSSSWKLTIKLLIPSFINRNFRKMILMQKDRV